MAQHHTSTDLIDEQMAVPDMRMHIGARLQCFAGYAEDPTSCEGPIVGVAIHKLSRRRVTTQSVTDLRIGSIVRLRIPMLGWRHLEVRWIVHGMAGYDFLLPLLPCELHLALEHVTRGHDVPPPRGPAPFASARRPIAVRTAPRKQVRSRRLPPLLPDLEAAGHAAVGALTRWFAALLSFPAPSHALEAI
jgi:hypothetical protein